MTKVLASVVAAAAISMAGSAMAADLIVDTPMDPIPVAEAGDWYVSLFGGGVWMPTVEADYYGYDYVSDPDFGYALGITVGTKVFDYLRIEGELSGTINSIDEVYSEFEDDTYDIDGSISSVYLLGNAWFDLDTGSGFTPYIGGGIGAAYVNVDLDFSDNLDGYAFAYQLGAGVKVDVADNVALDLGYRYKAIPDITVTEVGEDDDELDLDLSSHVVQAGLTFKF